ncbi:D-alanyl-D-alanine carboxypeptidase/D-alanyl-D-alanine-endopeptidase [Brumimicrobium salinarum]|uniref:D-alanyl-D-alanine carboxypeptidase/D-alanyl-D-alanine-endopeptidase n=1 Tax=Brumimicrobium salinarum TaxID=2058658 RepID=A0A2I0QZA7_9FLAO|nr:D-alanyl-D-alanine carboxypeptidase/D-alanyl-D-alanine-endopeptidase [Brumimicrobium salinarum]PKR79647.1 D-alanyl-D-alanine carboxypeptidase/D-alanyl-D-alanine-endopeptidase [Brumimicrobium salinarum]
MKITFVWIFCFIFINLSVGQQQYNSVQQAIHLFSDHDALQNTGISFLAYDIEKDSIIAQLNHETAIIPASTVKLFTTATAFEVLGKDFKPKTFLYSRGEVDSTGTLNGDLIIQGFGDASLGSKYFNDEESQFDFLNEWIKAIESEGIQKINGKIIADGSAFGYDGAPNGWSWADMGNYYGAGPSACAVHDNMTRLHFSTPAQLNYPTRLDSLTPTIPGFQLFNQVTTHSSRRDKAYVYGTPFSYQRFAIGSIPRSKSNFEVKASIPDPELLLAQIFEKSLEEAGIEIKESAVGMRSLLQINADTTIHYAECKKLLEYEGESIADVAYWTNLRSVNFFAEQLLSLSAYEKEGVNTTDKSSKFVNDYWEPRLGIKMMQTDGSGLSRTNAFSALHFVELLKYMHKSENFSAYEETLPIAGESGTLRGVCRGQAAQGRMKAKSGTMNRIKSYAGYIDSRNGKKIAFALIVNNDDLSNYQLVKRMERVFNAMANY